MSNWKPINRKKKIEEIVKYCNYCEATCVFVNNRCVMCGNYDVIEAGDEE